MIKKISSYLGFGKMGWSEFIIALFPILAGYSYGSFRLSFGVLLVLDILIVLKGNNVFLKCLPLAFLSIYIVLHDIILALVTFDSHASLVNSIILIVVYAVSLFIITPKLDLEKLRSSIFFISFACMIGMIYHISIIAAGGSVSPIKLPFLPDTAPNTRLHEIVQRPTSFFWEPQSYASYMLAPLFFSLKERKIIYASIIAALMIASTSTTGLILSLMMFLLFLFSNRKSKFSAMFIIIAMLVLWYFLTSSSYTAAGLDKFQNTNIEESNRISNGILILQSMDVSNLIFGIPFANVQDAYNSGYFGSSVIVYDDGVMFLSAIWLALVQYGIFGFILFLWPYFWILKKDYNIFPYLACVFAGHFSNPDFFGGAAYTFQIMVMLAFVSGNKNKILHKNHESFNSNISVC